MNFLELAHKRYSCRRMSDRKVEPELVDKLLEAAMTAPTAVNLQPVKVWVLDSEEARETVRSAARSTFGADTFLLVGGHTGDAWVRDADGKNFADVDAAIVATHIMMEIADLGLATTWIGHFDCNKFKERFPELREYELIALFPIGYASDDPKGGPCRLHEDRKPREEMVGTL